MEEWRDIIGFDNYQISNTGRVKNINTNKIKSLVTNKRGYVYISLWEDNKMTNIRLHRLVALNFIPYPKEHYDGKYEVNHKDDNKLNNEVSNLEWVTRSQNLLHAGKLGLKCKLNELDRQNVIRLREEGLTYERIGKIYSVTKQGIFYIVKNFGTKDKLRHSRMIGIKEGIEK